VKGFIDFSSKKKKFVLFFFPSTQTAYSIRKTRITKIVEKYQNRSNNLDEFFQNTFFLSTTTKQTSANPILTVQS